jgi:hypothetical protein
VSREPVWTCVECDGTNLEFDIDYDGQGVMHCLDCYVDDSALDVGASQQQRADRDE